MPKRFKIKGSGRIVEYEKDPNTGGYRVKGDKGGCAVGKKADKGGCSVGKKKSPFGNNAVVRNNPEIFKRLGIEDMAIPDWAYERKDPEPEEEEVPDPEAEEEEYKVPAYEDPRHSRVEEEGDIRLYRRDLDSGDFTHYDKQTGKWIPSNDPDSIYYEGGGYGYNEFESEERDGFEHISVNTYGEDDRSHFQFTKDNISRKERILPEEHMPKKKKKLTKKDFIDAFDDDQMAKGVFGLPDNYHDVYVSYRNDYPAYANTEKQMDKLSSYSQKQVNKQLYEHYKLKGHLKHFNLKHIYGKAF